MLSSVCSGTGAHCSHRGGISVRVILGALRPFQGSMQGHEPRPALPCLALPYPVILCPLHVLTHPAAVSVWEATW